MRRDLAIALSLANLCLLKVWGRVALYSGADAFHMKQFPGAAPILAAALNMAFLSALFWTLLRLSRSGRIWVAAGARILLGAAVLAALNSIRAILFGRFPALRGAVVSSFDGNLRAAGVLAAAILAAVLLSVAARRARRIGGILLMSLTPLAPIVLVGAAGRLFRLPPNELAEPKLSPPHRGRDPRTRVVWVVFDEWDQRRAFEVRPEGLVSPRLDQLSAVSLFATQAYPPATDTVKSIASLLAGERFAEAKRTGPSELYVRRAGDPALTRWSSALTVLARARETGVNTAAAGWYFPYCRILADAVSACHWCELVRGDVGGATAGRSLGWTMAAQMRGLFETAQFSILGRSQGLEGQARSHRELMAAGLDFASDPSLGFVFLHLPIPHAPYLRRAPDGTLSGGDYATSLALVDETVGRLIEAMEARGVWGSTHLLLSADHSLRGVSPEDRRVPFILRLATDSRGRKHTGRFSTEASAELLLGALRGEVSDYGSAVRRLGSRP